MLEAARAIPTLAVMAGCINNARHSGGWVAGHALGWGGQDSTVDPKGSLEAVPRVADANRLLAASVGRSEQLSSTDDVIGTPLRRTGESP